MIACLGRLQRESEVIHVVAEELIDLSDLLAGVGRRGAPFPLSHGRGDQVTHSGGPTRARCPAASRAASMYPTSTSIPSR